jgi:hypothetical protein
LQKYSAATPRVLLGSVTLPPADEVRFYLLRVIDDAAWPFLRAHDAHTAPVFRFSVVLALIQGANIPAAALCKNRLSRHNAELLLLGNAFGAERQLDKKKKRSQTH